MSLSRLPKCGGNVLLSLNPEGCPGKNRPLWEAPFHPCFSPHFSISEESWQKMVWEKAQLLSDHRKRRGLYIHTYISTSQRALDVSPSKTFLPASSRALSCTEEIHTLESHSSGFLTGSTMVMVSPLRTTKLKSLPPRRLRQAQEWKKPRPGHSKWRATK